VSEEEDDKRLVIGVKANDPAALSVMGASRYDEGDYESAFEYWTKAAELGDSESYYKLGFLYRMGRGVEEDEEKAAYHWEKAAIGGHPLARYALGAMEARNGNMERAVKHHIIAANLGYEKSLEALRMHYSIGNITKEDLDATLRSHQAAVDETKSKQRDSADVAAVIKHAESLHDKELFEQPEISHLGECPICFLPLSLDMSKSILKSCCSKLICSGCICANIKYNINDPVKGWSCPLCRDPCDEKYGKRNMKKLMKRVKANDPAALCEIGKTRHQEGNFAAAFKYLTKAAELGDASAHHNLSCMYRDGQGVEKDEEKEIHHSERAAIGGHPDARFKLACYEGDKNYERSVRHLIIGANLGCNKSMDMLWEVFRCGADYVTKEDLEAALRGHKAAVDATKSEQRDAAECGGEWRQIIIAQMRR
jgi:TPR repeat protein